MSKSSSPRIPTMISAAVSQDISNIVLALPDCGTAVLVGQKQSDTAANRSCCSSSNFVGDSVRPELHPLCAKVCGSGAGFHSFSVMDTCVVISYSPPTLWMFGQ